MIVNHILVYQLTINIIKQYLLNRQLQMIHQQKNYSQLCKRKSNPGSNVLTLKNYQNLLTEIKQNSQKKPMNTKNHTKLYTFCANEVTAKKSIDKDAFQNEQNYNQNQRIIEQDRYKEKDRRYSKLKQKIMLSTNDIREKIHIKQSKSKRYLPINRSKEPKSRQKSINRSHSESKIKQPKMGKSININLLQSLSSNEFKEADQRSVKQSYNSHQNILHLQQRDEGQNQNKIVINQEELKRFTKRFAQQKINYEQTIEKLKKEKEQLQNLNQQLQIEKNDLLTCLTYNKQLLTASKEQNETLEEEVSYLKNQHKYLQILKQESQRKITTLQIVIQKKDAELNSYRMSKNASDIKNQSGISQNLKQHYQNQIELMKIQLQYLSNELKINSISPQISESFLNSQTQNYQNHKIHKFEQQINQKNEIIEQISQQLLQLKEVNNFVTKQLQKMLILKTQNDTLIKTFEIREDKQNYEPFGEIMSQIRRVSKGDQSMHINQLQNSISIYHQHANDYLQAKLQ